MPIKDFHHLYVQSPRLNQLNILREIGAKAHVTQAELAGRCSLSVAMVNNYMKELCGAGLIEYHRKTSKSVTYHLTPSGAQHLERLQSELISDLVRMFVSAREEIRARIVGQAGRALRKVVLFGSGPLAQLTFHALELAGIKILGVCDDNPSAIGGDFCGREVLSPAQVGFLAPDAVIVSDLPKLPETRLLINTLSNGGIGVIPLNSFMHSASELEIAGKTRSEKAYPDYRDNILKTQIV
jgi:DNA-binding MarR family transcriptional regulator